MSDFQADHRLERCDAWLAAGVEETLYDALLENPSSLRYLKAICEIAFFICVRPDTYSDRLVRASDKVLGSVWADGQLLCLTRHNLQHANLFLPLLFACRLRLNLTTRQLVDIQHVTRLAMAFTKERIPFRDLDLRYVYWKITGDVKAKDSMYDFASRGCLRELASPSLVSYDDDYAITHTIFYLTDFGADPWPVRAGIAQREAVDGILEALRIYPKNQKNLDLRGEFLLSRRYLRTEFSVVRTELQSIAAAQNAEGWWDGPVDLSAKLREEEIPANYWKFMLNYHTTLVCREAVAAWSVKTCSATLRPSILPTDKLESANLSTIVLPSVTRDVESLRELQRSYESILLGESFPLREEQITNPHTITGTAELYLGISALKAVDSETRNALLEFASQLEQRIPDSLRVARIALTLLCAANGRIALQPWNKCLRTCLNECVPRIFSNLSDDEAFLLALGCLGSAFDNVEREVVNRALSLQLYRLMGAQDIAGVGCLALVCAVAGMHARLAEVSDFFQSYRASSVPFGYLDPKDEALQATIVHAAIAYSQYELTLRISDRQAT